MDQKTAGGLRVERRGVFNASADAVWALAGDFGRWDGWHPAIQTCELIEGQGNQPGVVRKLGLGGDASLIERLLSHSDVDKCCTYVIVSGVLPVRQYESTLQVNSTPDGKAEIIWSSTFEADGVSDEEAVKVIAGVYEGGFEALNTHFG